MSDDRRSRIGLSQHGYQAQIAPSITRHGSVVVGFYNAAGDASTNPGCFTPDEWDAFVAAGNRALGRAILTTLAALADRIETEPGAPVDLSGVCHEGREEDIYGKGYAKGRADAAVMVREAAQVDRAEAEALRARVAELEAALADIDERLQHEAWERSERD